MEQRTCKTIMSAFDQKVAERHTISPSEWIDASLYLVALMGDENDKLFDLEQAIALTKMSRIENGDSVAKAKSYIETTDTYKEAQKQKAFINQIDDFIKLAKLQARLRQDDFNNQGGHIS